MLKDLLNKKIDLYKTFYGYGLFGLLAARLVVKLFDFWVIKALGGISIIEYFKRYFDPLNANMNAVFATICYLVSVCAFAYYIVIVLKLVWKSCADFEKSAFLEFLARIIIVLWAFALGWSIF